MYIIMSKENKKQKNVKIKEICKKYNVIGSVSVEYGRSIVLTIKSGEIDFYGNYKWKTSYYKNLDIEVHNIGDHNRFTGTAQNFLSDVLDVLHDQNGSMIEDRVIVNWRVDVRILSTYQLLQPTY